MTRIPLSISGACRALAPCRALAGLLLLALAGGVTAQPSAVPTSALPVRVAIDFFYEPGCEECHRVTTEVLPSIRNAYGDLVVLRSWDTNVDTNYLRLAAWLERFGFDSNQRVFMILDGKTAIAGADAISTGLVSMIEASLRDRMENPPEAAVLPLPERRDAFLAARVKRFTLASVMAGGLVDGINPCAFSTLVFLISVLSLSRVQGSHLLRVGFMFCLASFLTYTAIGFGLLRTLQALSCIHAIRRVLDVVLGAILVALALFSFRDAIRFHRTGSAQSVLLQLPDRMKNRIHRIVRTGLSQRAQAASAFAVGAAVTALESVCTGQVYVPTLALVVKSGANVVQGLAYLLLYNLMFVLPLLAVFLLTFHGLKLSRLMTWSRRNVVASKALMGVFFLALAAAVWLLR